MLQCDFISQCDFTYFKHSQHSPVSFITLFFAIPAVLLIYIDCLQASGLQRYFL